MKRLMVGILLLFPLFAFAQGSMISKVLVSGNQRIETDAILNMIQI